MTSKPDLSPAAYRRANAVPALENHVPKEPLSLESVSTSIMEINMTRPTTDALDNTGSADDPHGGQDMAAGDRPDPDPIAELATIDDSGEGGAPDRPHLARQPGPKPGFGPDEFASPKLEGNAELGIDPHRTDATAGNGR